MLFNSFQFAAFFLIVAAIYYLPGFARYQVHVLTLASLVFYASGQPALVALLLSSIAINALTSFGVLRAQRQGARVGYAATGVGLNLGLLLFFKYGPLAVQTFHLGTGSPESLGAFLLTIPLPIGISFFTFQGISLLVDTFRDRNAILSGAEPHFRTHCLQTAFFKSFFPQLIAGPIVKAHDFYPQIKAKRFADIRWDLTVHDVLIGYFLKMVVADNLKDLTYWMEYPYFLGMSALNLLAMLFGYSIQIFADFCGYSLIAVGLARFFGYELRQNFDFPYIAQSLSEFWRRWHISLSSWLREYLYIPLGGNRHGEARTYLNLMVVMFLGGLWHGAAWSYAVWGLYHGLGLAVERMLVGRTPRGTPASFSIPKATGIFAFVTAGWLLFKLPKFSHVVEYAHAIISNASLHADSRQIAFILFYSAPVVLHHLYALGKSSLRIELSLPARSLGYAVCLCAILLNSGSSGAFIYFQF